MPINYVLPYKRADRRFAILLTAPEVNKLGFSVSSMKALSGNQRSMMVVNDLKNEITKAQQAAEQDTVRIDLTKLIDGMKIAYMDDAIRVKMALEAVAETDPGLRDAIDRICDAHFLLNQDRSEQAA